jgi:3-hydroxybutyryl-CoA dehydratase
VHGNLARIPLLFAVKNLKFLPNEELLRFPKQLMLSRAHGAGIATSVPGRRDLRPAPARSGPGSLVPRARFAPDLEREEMTELCYEDIKVGDEASLTRTITETHIVTYAGLTGDMNPVHVDAEYAAKSMFGERIAHGMLTAGLISAVLGTQLPGPNSIYLGQDLKFMAPVRIGDTVRVTVTVTEKRDDKPILKLRTTAINQNDEMVLDGTAVMKKLSCDNG